MTKRVALYLRVSTTEQTVENQRRELEAVAARHGWTVAMVCEDAGISGAKGRDGRPGLDRLFKAVARLGPIGKMTPAYGEQRCTQIRLWGLRFFSPKISRVPP